MTHECLNARRCQPGHHPRTTINPETLCDQCITRAQHRITQLPTQHLHLHAMLGEHTTGSTPTRSQPESAVLINVVIDTILEAIHHHTTLAAEIVADQLNTDNPHHHDRTRHVFICCQLIAPNLHKLLPITNIPVMQWDQPGTALHVTTTTGTAITQQLDHLSSQAHYTLGMTRARTYRDIPCARCTHRTVGRWAGAECYDCETCGTQWPETAIRRHDLMLLERHRKGLLHASA